MYAFIYRIVSLDLNAKMATEVEILCNMTSCGLVKPMKMALLTDQMYVLHEKKKMSVFKGLLNNVFNP